VAKGLKIISWHFCQFNHCQILSGIQQAAQTVLGIYLKRTCLHKTSASSALGGSQRLCAIQVHALNHSLWHWHWDFINSISAGVPARTLLGKLKNAYQSVGWGGRYDHDSCMCKISMLKVTWFKSYSLRGKRQTGGHNRLHYSPQ